MTTPRNFIFDPLGTERSVMFGFWFCVVCVVVVTWPKTAGAIEIKTASTQPTVIG
jgi:hypothetical protein